MKKYLKFIIILVVLIIVSVVAYIAVDKSKSNDEQKLMEQGIEKISQFDVSTLKGITVSDSSGTYDLILEEKGWNWGENSAAFRINNTKVSQVAAVLSDLSSTKVIEENAQNLSQYGLENGIEISFSLTDGSKHSVKLGSATPTNTGYYIKKSEENKIYMISTDDGEALYIDRNQIKSPYILDVTSNEITNISLERNQKVIFDAEKNENGTWELISPVSNVNVDHSEISAIVEPSIRVASYKYIEENPTDLSKYGLDTPSYALELATEEQSSKVIFGDIPDDDAYGIYALVSNDDYSEVVIFPKDSTVFKKNTEDVINPLLYGHQNSKIDSVNLTLDGKKIEMSVNSKTKIYNFNGVEITDEERVSLCAEFLQSINTATFNSIDTEAVIDTSTTPEIEIKFTFKDDTTDNTALYKGDNGYYLVRDGKYTGLTVSNETVTAIKAAYSGILNRVSEEQTVETTEISE